MFGLDGDGIASALVDLPDVTVHLSDLFYVRHGEVITVWALEATAFVFGLNVVIILRHAGECHILTMAVDAKVPGKQLLSIRLEISNQN